MSALWASCWTSIRPKWKLRCTKQFKGKAKAVALNKQALEVGTQVRCGEPGSQRCSLSLPTDECDQGQNHHRRQCCGCAGLHVRRHHGCDLVSDYAVIESLRNARGLHAGLPSSKRTAKRPIAIVQAEDELAAIGMAIGAGWAGARSMTSTAGPGISLMKEFIGLAYYAEIPVVIFDITRVGPSTGLPTRTQQSDILSMVYCSHGDTKHIMLLPGSVDGMLRHGGTTPSICRTLPDSDLRDERSRSRHEQLDVGSVQVSRRKKFDRGKVLSAEDLQKLGSFKRYADVDGDGIGYRTLPGTDHPAAAYFTRGSGHNEKALYSERPDDYKNNMDRLAKKYDTAREHVPQPEIEYRKGAKIGFLAFGTTHWAIIESQDQLAEGIRHVGQLLPAARGSVHKASRRVL